MPFGRKARRPAWRQFRRRPAPPPRVLRTSARRESNGEGFQLLVVQPALPCNDGMRDGVRRRVVGRRPPRRHLNGCSDGWAGVRAFGDGADVQPPPRHSKSTGEPPRRSSENCQ